MNQSKEQFPGIKIVTFDWNKTQNAQHNVAQYAVYPVKYARFIVLCFVVVDYNS